MRIQYPRQRSQDVIGFLDAYFLGPGRAGKDYLMFDDYSFDFNFVKHSATS
jgi:hypothetical protein